MRGQMGPVAILLAASLAGCASAGDGARTSSSVVERTRVRVANHNWSDMNVYIDRDGMRTRLGTVTTASSRTFTLPRGVMSVSGTLRLVADPIGGSAVFVTSPLLVSPGQLVEFTIENRVSLSSYTVWR